MHLDLDENQITSIERGVFNGLNHLYYLELGGNQITSIEHGAFEALSNLGHLELDENQITSIERGVFNGLTKLQSLKLGGSQITSIQGGAFEGLTNLAYLGLDGNRITSIQGGAFEGLTNLRHLQLDGNTIQELNFAGATFEHLYPCFARERGFCVDGSISRLILDGAMLSLSSFRAIVGATTPSDVSLVGLRFSDMNPTDLSNLWGLASLEKVAVDSSLYALYADEFDAFVAIDGHTVTVVPGLCDVNRDGRCDVADIDAMTQNVVAGVNREADHVELIKRPMPHGFGTYLGDANLDGEFNSSDLVTVFEAGKYEQDVVASWSEGDWGTDGHFGTGDLVAAFQDGGYEQGPQPVGVVPEPASSLILLAGLIGLGSVSRNRRKRF